MAAMGEGGGNAVIDRARFGPLITAIRSGPMSPTSAMTSLIRLSVPISTPLARLTTVAPRGSWSAQSCRCSRSRCAGIASTTVVTPSSAAAASCVARSADGSLTSGRYSGFTWSAAIASATS